MPAEKDPARDYQKMRADRQAALTDDERALYEQAYHDAVAAWENGEENSEEKGDSPAC